MHTVTASPWTLSPLPSFLMADVSELNRLLQRFSFLPLIFGDVSPHFDAFQWIEEEFDNFFCVFHQLSICVENILLPLVE
jgi:hypothetical protein